MNAQTKIDVPTGEKLTGLSLLRAPFPPNQISKLPKETKAQIDARTANRNLMVWKCAECGGHHHKDAVHLDYVGHAALTDRLLDCDPEWNWEPIMQPGLPNPGNGMWIRLTVCGVSRIGFGDAGKKQGGDAIKEVIGDALRNAAMRFGAALDLWHKGDLHADDAGDDEAPAPEQKSQRQSRRPARDDDGMPSDAWAKLIGLIEATNADTQKMLNHFGVPDLKKLSPQQYDQAVAKLENDLVAMAKEDANRRGGTAHTDNSDIDY